MRRGVRFFYVMGVVIVLLSFWQLTLIGNLPREFSDLEWFFVVNWLVWLSIGFTEIAVGWLLERG